MDIAYVFIQRNDESYQDINQVLIGPTECVDQITSTDWGEEFAKFYNLPLKYRHAYELHIYINDCWKDFLDLVDSTLYKEWLIKEKRFKSINFMEV